MTNNNIKIGNPQLTDTRSLTRIHTSRPVLAIVVGGFIVGVLDLLYAFTVFRTRPIIILQGIASGVLGEKSFRGGIASAALGICFHFTIAFGAALTYYLASRKLTFLISRAVPCGLLYGAFVYFFMYVIVLPLSAGQFPFSFHLREFVWHWFGVGLPIALSVRHYSR